MKLIRKEWIFDENAPTPECHASTVLKLEDGRLLTAWFGGEREGKNDVMIWLSRWDENGWSDPVCVSKEAGIPHWNPVLLKRRDGAIVLFYKVGKTIADWITKCRVSYDNCKTWSESFEMVSGDDSGGRGPVRNKAIHCMPVHVTRKQKEITKKP